MITAAPVRELRWLGRLLIPALFDDEHSLRLEPTLDGDTRFTQAEKFSGILVAPFKGVPDSTAMGFGQMNQALKAALKASRELSCDGDGRSTRTQGSSFVASLAVSERLLHRLPAY